MVGGARRVRNMRARAAARARARAAAAAEEEEEEEEENYEGKDWWNSEIQCTLLHCYCLAEFSDDEFILPEGLAQAGVGKIGTKKLRKLQYKAEKKAMREVCVFVSVYWWCNKSRTASRLLST